MGTDVNTYRARIGTFLPSSHRCSILTVQRNTVSALLQALLPRPSYVLASLCLALLLLSAGDIEANPGPGNVEDVLNLLKDFSAENDQNFKATTATLEEIKRDVVDIKSRIDVIEQNMGGVSSIKENVCSVHGVITEVKSVVASTSNDLGNVVDDLNNRMRRNNLLVKGMPETEGEEYENTESKILEFISTHLKVKLDANDIERAHRIGRRRDVYKRPIIIKFLNFKVKEEVLRNAFNLKDVVPKMWLEEDFSPKIQLQLKKTEGLCKKYPEGK
ncbi:hypothetical protein V5799_001214 [Amblyomma americanum]|uniref:Uncharacterized protein n=1 Tax=Amblyomma americanum TaxID=6943 RepID=A0AAQ4D0R7_AMBAM